MPYRRWTWAAERVSKNRARRLSVVGAQIAVVHELVGGAQTRHIRLGHRRHDRAVLHRRTQIVMVVELGETLASLDRAAQECPHPALGVQLRLLLRHAAAQLLLSQLPQHHVDGFRPSGQELPGIEPGRAFLAEGAFLDHDDIEPAPDRGVRRAQTR